MVPISATLFVTLPFPHCTPRSCRGEVLIWTGERLNKQKAKVSLMGFRPLEKVRVRWYWGILSPASKSSLYMPSLLTSSNNYVRNTCATKVKSGLKGKMQSFCNLMWTFLSIYLYPLYGDRKSLLEICKAAGNSGKEFRVLVKKKTLPHTMSKMACQKVRTRKYCILIVNEKESQSNMNVVKVSSSMKSRLISTWSNLVWLSNSQTRNWPYLIMGLWLWGSVTSGQLWRFKYLLAMGWQIVRWI